MKMIRIGLLVPSTNTSVEADFQHTAPENVTTHAQRLWIPPGEMSEHHLDEMNSRLKDSVISLASANMDLMVYACTSGSFYRGPAFDDNVVAEIKKLTGLPAITTSQAVTSALRKFGARRLSVATPYPAWTNERLRKYFESLGFELLNVETDVSAAAGGHRCINDQEPERIVAFGKSIMLPQAELLFCSCTAWRSLEAADALEKALGKPVVSSNQATVWRAYRDLGITGQIRGGGGRLFEM